MATQVADDEPVQTSVSWEDRRWWSGALNMRSALDYFAHSQFYDRTCLNEQLKMQQTMLSAASIQERLERLPGVLYMLDDDKSEEIPPTAQEPAHTLYVVRKLVRADGNGPPRTRETTLRYYYILDGVVYECPTLEAVVRARLEKISWHLREAFKVCAPATESGSDSGARGGSSKKRPREAS